MTGMKNQDGPETFRTHPKTKTTKTADLEIDYGGVPGTVNVPLTSPTSAVKEST